LCDFCPCGQPDGKFGLYNECTDAKGKLVTFLRPFSADYRVIDPDQDYKWALAGQPSRDYL
jgi:lipocalin